MKAKSGLNLWIEFKHQRKINESNKDKSAKIKGKNADADFWKNWENWWKKCKLKF